MTLINEASSMYLGNASVNRIYVGAHRIWPEWSPLMLFDGGQNGAWFDPSDMSALFQDTAGTIPVTSIGQPVGMMLDKSGNNNHSMQGDASARPTLQQDVNGKYFLNGDGVNDSMDFGNITNTNTFAVAYHSLSALGGTVGVFAGNTGNNGIMRAGGTLRMYPGGLTTGVNGLDGPKTIIGTSDGIDNRCTIMPGDVDVSIENTSNNFISGRIFRVGTSAARATGNFYGGVILTYVIGDDDRSRLHHWMSLKTGI